MFERYTEPARRVIFFARYEASTFGSPWMEPEHILLGLLREDTVFRDRVKQAGTTPESMRSRIKDSTPVREKISTSVDLPMSDACKRLLTRAAEESDSLGHRTIDCGHLVLALLREDDSMAASILLEHGIDYSRYQELVKTTTRVPVSQPANPHTRPADRESLWEDAELPIAAPSLRDSIEALEDLLDHSMRHLETYSEVYGAGRLVRKPWTRKEALGHLVDLATTQHRRLARALTEPNVADSGPPLETWVTAQHYSEFPWPDLVDLWVGLNRLLVHVLCKIPEEKSGASFRIGLEAAVPLTAVVDRYIAECEDIMGQILSRL